MQRDAKTKLVMDNAGDLLNRYWNGISIKDIPVTSTYLPCDHDQNPWNDFEDLQKYLKIAPTKVKKAEEWFKGEELSQILRFWEEHYDYLNHVDRRSAFAMLMKCSKSSCLKCSERPIQMEVMKPFTDFLNKCGGKWYSPTPVPETPAHYLTVQQVLNLEGNLETCPDQFMM